MIEQMEHSLMKRTKLIEYLRIISPTFPQVKMGTCIEYGDKTVFLSSIVRFKDDKEDKWILRHHVRFHNISQGYFTIFNMYNMFIVECYNSIHLGIYIDIIDPVNSKPFDEIDDIQTTERERLLEIINLEGKI